MAKTKIEIRRENKLKKKRFYERHGITFNKTVRKRVVDTINRTVKGRLYNGERLLYENYKDPLKPIEKNKGYGYYGTVAITEDGEYIQCHICSNLYQSLGGHLRLHKITAEKYKETYGLAATASLLSEPARIRHQEQVVSKISGGGLPAWLEEYNKKVQSGEIKHVGTKRKEGGWSLQRRNEEGTCPDQILLKIRELAETLGHTPSHDEFVRHYNYRYIHTIVYHYGSYLNAVSKLGMKSAKELKERTREELLEELVEFHEKYDRIPMTSDWKRGLLTGRSTYFKYFGTLNNARTEAGLNAVLPLGFGNLVEMTPDQYAEYRSAR